MHHLLKEVVAFWRTNPAAKAEFPNFDELLHNAIRMFFPNHYDPHLNRFGAVDLEAFLGVALFQLAMLNDQSQTLERLLRCALPELVARYLLLLNATAPRNNRLRDFILHELRPTDIVVSLNWDVLVESYLRELGVIPNYGQRLEREYRLYKPHGSINWDHAPKHLAPHPESDLVPISKEHNVFFDPHLRADTSFMALGEAPLLVLPYSDQLFLDFIRGMWISAIVDSKLATKVFVIGYSFPLSDRHVGALFGYISEHNPQACSNTIEIIDPQAGHAKFQGRYLRHLRRTDVRFIASTFEDWGAP